jgi:hypothetical protein
MAEVESKLDTLTVIKRNGKKVDFDSMKIAVAIKKGFDNLKTDRYAYLSLGVEYTEKDSQKVFQAVMKRIEKDYKDADTALASRVLAVEQAVGAEGGSVDTQIGIKIASELGKLNYESGEGQYVASVKQTNGKVEVTMGNFNFATPTDVTNAKNAVIGDPTNDTAESVTIYGSRKYAAAQASSAQAAAINAAASDATSKANAAEAAAKSYADGLIAAEVTRSNKYTDDAVAVEAAKVAANTAAISALDTKVTEGLSWVEFE